MSKRKQSQPETQNIGDGECWSIIKSIDNPIWSQKLITDTQNRIKLDDLPPPPENIRKVYHFINTNINHIIESTIKCENPTSYDDIIQTGIQKASQRKTAFCCGFTAPVLAAYLFILITSCQTKTNDYNKCFDTDFVQQVEDGFILHYKDETIPIDIKYIHTRLYNFFMLISGYADLHSIGWNERCPRDTELSEGINLVSLTSYGDHKYCSTYHHFTVYKINIYCVICDSWAGSTGHRSSWCRIMKTNDLRILFKQINDCNDAILRKSILRNYFNAPPNDTFPHILQVGILNKDSEPTSLYDSFWKYLSMGSIHKASKLVTANIGTPTQEANDALNPFDDPDAANEVFKFIDPPNKRAKGINKKSKTKFKKRQTRNQQRSKKRSRKDQERLRKRSKRNSRKRSRKQKNIDEIYEEIL